MSKIFKSLLLSLLGSLTLYGSSSQESFRFLSIGTAKQHFSLPSSSPSENLFSLRYGEQTHEWRTMFTYATNTSVTEWEMEIDNILFEQLFNTPKIRGYLGASVGSLSYQTQSLQDESGYYYGATSGLMLYLNERFDIDLGYGYYWIENFTNLKKSQAIRLSLHYFY